MKKFIFVTVAFLSACTSINKNVQHVTHPESTTKLTIYREPGFMAGAVNALVGENKQYFMSLANGDFARFHIDSGDHTFQVDVDGAPAYELTLSLKPKAQVCIKIES